MVYDMMEVFYKIAWPPKAAVCRSKSIVRRFLERISLIRYNFNLSANTEQKLLSVPCFVKISEELVSSK